MNRSPRRRLASLTSLLAGAALSIGCAAGPITGDSSDTSESGEGTGGATDGGTESSAGDGDGDAGDGDGSAGDGDGSGGDGDGSGGDGDGSTGDGDGSSGDGDGTSGDGDGDGTGTLSCFEVIGCTEACADQACIDDCTAQGSASGAAEATAFFACVEASGCMNDNCIEQACAAEIVACSYGDMTCSESYACVIACAGDEGCEGICWSESTALAQGQLDAFGTCIEANGCADQACIDANCPGEQVDCLSGNVDQLECPLLAGCLNDCGGDPACNTLCEASGGAAALAEAQAMIDCGTAMGCGMDFDCSIQACPSEWQTCSTGTMNCADTWACFEGCLGGELCEQNCAYSASSAGQILFGALVDCSEANGCQDQACLDANCSFQQSACLS